MTEYNPNKSFYIPDKKFWERVKEKANRSDIDRSISQIVVRLLELWLDGEVAPYPEKNTNE